MSLAISKTAYLSEQDYLEAEKVSDVKQGAIKSVGNSVEYRYLN